MSRLLADEPDAAEMAMWSWSLLMENRESDTPAISENGLMSAALDGGVDSPPAPIEMPYSPEERERMVLRWLYLPRWVLAQSFQWALRAGLRVDDAESAGFLGLVIAAHRFDKARGTRFATYAVYWIYHLIQEEIENSDLIHVPSARRRDCEDPDVRRARHVRGLPLDHEKLVGRPRAEVREPDEIEDLLASMRNLSQRERRVLELLYERGRTFGQAAQVMGVTKERVRDLEKSALAKLRRRILKRRALREARRRAEARMQKGEGSGARREGPEEDRSAHEVRILKHAEGVPLRAPPGAMGS